MGLLNQTQQDYYQGNDHGNYQFVSLADIINQFMVVYVGEDKIIPKAKRLDVAFHAQRALAELSFDTLKSVKAQEITLPPSLQMTMPHDYVNYTKVSWVDSAGIKHLLYPASKTSNPSSIVQNATDGSYSTLISAFNLGLSNDTSSFTLDTGITLDSTNNQVDFDSSLVVQYGKLNWSSIAPEVEKSYTLTYTISNVPYLDPSSTNPVAELHPRLIDAFGNDISFTKQSENGTYTQTVVMALSARPLTQQSSRFYFQSSSTTGFSGSISGVSLVESTDSALNAQSTTWSNYKSSTPSQNQSDDYQDDTYWPMDGSRYGLDPQHAQANGSFYIDDLSGKIHFSSNISGKTVILDYISDSLGTDGEMQVHKFAEEAMYKWISHAILAGRANIPEYQVNRFKKERFAAIRTAKLRLSNLKLEELTQILRGKSKQIKH
tara:strand:- start:145 stop:1446 length:1302 start_codon:yes stop_codon:yes gene_type:complete